MTKSYTKPALLIRAFLPVCLFVAAPFLARATRYYVSATGDNSVSAVQAQNPATAWQTLGFAVSQASAGDSIVVLAGTYSETNIAVNKSLRIFGNETGGVPGTGTRPVFSGSSPAASGSVLILQAAGIRIQNLEIHVDQQNTVNGIFSAAGGFNGLSVTDCHIFSTRSSTTFVFATYGIHLGQTSSTAGNDSSFLARNVIRPLQAGRAFFGRGVRLNGGFSQIGTGSDADSNSIQGIYGIQCGSSLGTIRVLNNRIYGQSAGLELNFPAASRNHEVRNNSFAALPGLPNYILIELKNNTRTGSNILIENNRFTGHTFSGIFSTRSRNVFVRNNEFTPSDTSKGFVHIRVNTKQQTTSTTEAPTSSSIVVEGNLFTANGFRGGRGVLFENHFSGATPPFVDVTVGGPGTAANRFAANLEQFVALDSASGNCKRLPVWNQPTIRPTQALPVDLNLDISNNQFDAGFGLRLPSAMNNTELVALENRLMHKVDFDSLGFLTVVPKKVIVTSTSFLSPKTVSPSVNRALLAPDDDTWTLLAEASDYSESVTLTRSLRLETEGTGAAGIGSLTLNGAGKTLTLAGNLSYSQNLIFNQGGISLADGNLIAGPAATASGADATRYVVCSGSGKFVKEQLNGDFTYPIGTPARFRPARLSNSGSAGDYGLAVRDDVLSSGLTGTPVDSVVGLTWLLDETNAGSATLTFEPGWTGSDEKTGFVRSGTAAQMFRSGQWTTLSGPSPVAATGTDPYQGSYSISSGRPFANTPIRVANATVGGNLYYVDNATGLDTRTAGEAKNPATPWKTIGKALAEVGNGDSVQVFAGDYSEANLSVTRSVVLLGNVAGVGTGAGAGTGVRPRINGTGLSPDSSIFTIRAPGVQIRNFRIEVNQGQIAHGILARNPGYNNLQILDNHIISTQANGSVLPCQDFNTYGIRLVGFQQDSFTIRRNIIAPAQIDGSVCFFGRGIKLFGGHGWIGGPQPADSNRILAYYSVQSGDADGGSLRVQNNFLLGIGVQVVAPAAGSGEHLIEANRFVVAFPRFFPTQCEIREVRSAGTSVRVNNNSFLGFSNSALFSQRSTQVTVENNVFTPVDTSRGFRAVVVNTKQVTAAVSQPPVASSIIIRGNTFRAGNTPGFGRAIEFGNHNDDPNTDVAFPNVVIGGAGNLANTFEDGLRYVLYLDASSGPSSQFPVWNNVPVTTMAPVADNFDIQENIFSTSSGPKRPAEMSLAELYDLENQVVHGIDVAALGFVTARPGFAYVTDQSFLAPFTSQPSVQRAHNKLQDGNTIRVQPRSVNEVLRVSRTLTIDPSPALSLALNGLRMLGAGKTLTLPDSLILSDSLELNEGLVDLGDGALVLEAGAENLGGNSNSYVRTVGLGTFTHRVQDASLKTYPLGVGTSFNPLRIQNNGTSDRLGAALINGVLENGVQADTVVGVTWVLNEGTPGGSGLAVDFQWNQSQERTGFDRTSLFVDRLTTGWENFSGTTPLSATGTDPHRVVATLNGNFSNLFLRLSSKEPQVSTSRLYYVDDNTGDDTRTSAQAKDPNTPWRTLTRALASVDNGDSIQVFPGNYPEGNLRVEKSVKILGSVIGVGTGPGAGTGQKPVVGGPAGGPDSTIFLVRAPNVEIQNIQVEVDQANVKHGIYSNGGSINNLRLLNLNVYSTGIQFIPGQPCITFQSYGMRFLNAGSDSVIVKGCFIQPRTINSNCAFGRGIRMFQGGRLIAGGPADADSNRIVAFYGVQLGDLSGPSVIENNLFAGQGVEITAPEANSGIHRVTGNRFLAVIPRFFLSLIELKDVQKAGTGVLVENNLISGHSNIGVFSARSRNITVRNNTFVPSDTARRFRHIYINTKQQTAALVQNPGINSIVIEGNDFQDGAVQAGVALDFVNHNDDPSSDNAFTGVVIGGAGAAANTFGPNMEYWVRLDPESGLSAAFPLWFTSPITPMRPVRDSFDFRENLFSVSGGPKRAADMSDAENYELEDKVLHAVDYDSLGFQSWNTNFAYLTRKSFLAPFTSGPSLQRVVNVSGSADGLQINIEPDSLSETVTVTRSMTWNAFPGDSVELGGISMNGTGKTLNLSDRFILRDTLDLGNAGGKVAILNSNLELLPTVVLTPGTDNSYVQTDGNGSLVHRGVNDQLRLFPVGTATGYAPVEFDDANNTGDRILVRVKPTSTAGDFTPALPAGVTTFARFQWDVCEGVPGGSNAFLRFDWRDPLNVAGGDPINAIFRHDGTNWDGRIASIGPGLTASASDYTDFCSPFAVVSDPNLTEITVSNPIKIRGGVAGRFCPGDSVKIPIKVVGSGLVVGNTFDAFLSNPDGTFPASGGTLMGSLLSNTSDTLLGVIPAATGPGLNYRIRVRSTNIELTSAVNPDSIRIFTLPARPVVTGDSVLCTGETTTLTSSSSTGYLWNPGGSTGQSVSIGASGSYTVRISDENGCTALSAVRNVVVFPNPVAGDVTFSGSLTRCDGDSIILTANPDGLSYTWRNTTPTVTTRNLTVKTNGSYSVIVTNVNGCSDTSAVVTASFNTLPAQPVITGPSAFVCQPNSLDLQTGPGFTYEWNITGVSPNPTTANVSLSQPGSYTATVTITDANNCRSTSNPFLGELRARPGSPQIQNVTNDASVCQGDSIVLRPFPLSASNTYTWTPGPVTGSTLVIKTPGLVTVSLAVDSNGCSNTGSGTVQVNVNPRPTTPLVTLLQGTNSFCQGGSAVLESSESAGYLWSPGGATTRTLIVQNSGIYSVVVRDDSSCTSLPSAGIDIEVKKNPEVPLIQASRTVFCAGQTATIQVTNAGSGNTYSWTPSGTGTSLTVTEAGSYTVRADSANGCFAVSAGLSIVVNPLPQPVISSSEPDNRVCTGNTVVLSSNASSGNEWLGVGTPVPTSGSITLSVTTPNISLRVTDANGCQAVSSTVSVKVDTLPRITLLRDTALIIRDDFQLEVSRFPANARVYEWYQEGNLLGQSNEPRFSFTAGQTSRYWVILTDSNGCKAQDTVLVRVGSEVFVPNSFSPNGDRRNDRFKVYGFGVRDIEVRIWDRLGNLVYETDRVDDIVETSDSEDTVKGWDGTWKGKELSQEAYIWSIKGTFNSGEPLRVRGGKNSGSVLLMN